MLVLCTGNLCRSPLAGAILERMAGERGVPVEVRTRGLMAVEGKPPPPETLRAAREAGLDLSGHLGRRLNAEDLEWADRVLVMEPWQKETVLGMRRGGARVQGLWEWAPGAPGEIPDPYMEDPGAHLRTVRLLEQALAAWWEEGGPGR